MGTCGGVMNSIGVVQVQVIRILSVVTWVLWTPGGVNLAQCPMSVFRFVFAFVLPWEKVMVE